MSSERNAAKVVPYPVNPVSSSAEEDAGDGGDDEGGNVVQVPPWGMNGKGSPVHRHTHTRRILYARLHRGGGEGEEGNDDASYANPKSLVQRHIDSVAAIVAEKDLQKVVNKVAANFKTVGNTVGTTVASGAAYMSNPVNLAYMSNPANLVNDLARVVKEGQGPNLRQQLAEPHHKFRMCGIWKTKALDPRSLPVVIWHLVVLVALVSLFILVPVELAFVPYERARAWEDMSDEAKRLFIVGRCFDAVFLVDILMNFFTGFYHEETQAWIVSLPDIWRRYALSWLLVDAVALVPFEYVLNHGRVGRSIKLLRINKLLSGLKVNRLTHNFLSRNEINLQVFELIQQVFIASACVHIVCCGWCFVLIYEQRQAEEPSPYGPLVSNAYDLGFTDEGGALNWVAANEVMGAEFEYYVAAMQLLFQGEMTPATLVERIMLIASMGLFYMMFIFIIAEVANILTEIGYKSSRYRQLLRDLNTLMREHVFPTDLRFRLRQYLRFRHLQQEGASMLASPERRYLLSLLSPQLRTEAMVHMNNTGTMLNVVSVALREGIGSVKLFRDTEVPETALLNLSLAARLEVYAGHEFVYKAGDPAAALNIAVKGLIIVKGRLVRRSDTFGEEAALNMQTAYIGSAFSVSYSTICHVGGKVIRAMYRKYPQTETKIRRTLARQFAREGLRNYIRYVNAARAGKLDEFRAAFFNQGFSDAMLFRMWIIYTKSEGEFADVENYAVRIQRIWRGRMLRRKLDMAQYKARMDREGIVSGYSRDEGGTVQKRRGFLLHGKTQAHLDKYLNQNAMRNALMMAKVLQQTPTTVESRLEQMEINQRAIMEQLLKLQEGLKTLGESSGGGGGGANDPFGAGGGISSGFAHGGIGRT